MLVKKSLHASKSLDVDLDNISNGGLLEKLAEVVKIDGRSLILDCSYKKKSQVEGSYKGED
jgi:hypothetical protein